MCTKTTKMRTGKREKFKKTRYFVSEQAYGNTTKKKNTFSRIQRIFKTSHRKEKHGSSSPRHGRATTAKGVPQRVSRSKYEI